MEKKFLVDVNLPYYFSHWDKEEFIHQRDINAKLPDKDIWEYAKARNLTIITKDADFADRIINLKPPPKVIHFKTGNMQLKIFHDFISVHWNEISELNMSHKLVNVYHNSLEGIN